MQTSLDMMESVVRLYEVGRSRDIEEDQEEEEEEEDEDQEDEEDGDDDLSDDDMADLLGKYDVNNEDLLSVYSSLKGGLSQE